jgi:hypothetical protein
VRESVELRADERQPVGDDSDVVAHAFDKNLRMALRLGDAFVDSNGKPFLDCGEVAFYADNSDGQPLFHGRKITLEVLNAIAEPLFKPGDISTEGLDGS